MIPFREVKKYLFIIMLAPFLSGCEEDGVCIVTGNKLGSMGDPVSFEHEGKTYKVCCAPCIKKFRKDPSKYLK